MVDLVRDHSIPPIRRVKKAKLESATGISQSQTIADFAAFSKIQKISHARISAGLQSGKTQKSSENPAIEPSEQDSPLPPLPMVIESDTPTHMVLSAIQPSIRPSAIRSAKPATQKRMLLPFPSRGTSAHKMQGRPGHALLASPAQSPFKFSPASPVPVRRVPTLGRIFAGDGTSRQAEASSSSQSTSVATLKSIRHG